MRCGFHCSGLNAVVAPRLVSSSSLSQDCRAWRHTSFPRYSAVCPSDLRSVSGSHEDQKLPRHILSVSRRRCGRSILDEML
ncbi:hypothetical protein KC332_g19 [Hortaea werneckii]|nr:hypothetical protein KC348_g25 [Hortaea werneckii]KAI7421932.1 hypothetical protein KC332_g19 [Hortaea werneckii]KAI7456570.1 hypothetical protein KC368_g54 [Hortaea werneckii]